MAKAGRKRKPSRKKAAFKFEAELPTPEQLRGGQFERDFVTHAETNTKAMTHRRRDSSIVDKWFREKAEGFDEGARRAIMDCRELWSRMGEPRLIAQYGERLDRTSSDEGHTAQEASDEIALRKRMVPAKYWDVFENVVRHNEPAGVAGSNFANNPAQQIASARAIVGFVANIIAMRFGY